MTSLIHGDSLEVEVLVPETVQTSHRLTPGSRDDSDTRLVERARNGDRDAFSEIYRRHRPAVVTVCSNQLRSSGAPQTVAEDMVNDAFLRLLRSLSSITQPEQIDRWLKRTAKRLCIDYRRSAASRREVELNDEEADRLPDAGVGRGHFEDDVVRRATVQAIFAGVTETNSLLLREHYLEDRSVAEIAARHGSTPGSVKVRLHRGRGRAEQFALSNGLRGLVPLPAWAWLRRIAGVTGRPDAAAVVTVVAPMVVGVAVAVAISGGAAGAPPATANSARPHPHRAAAEAFAEVEASARNLGEAPDGGRRRAARTLRAQSSMKSGRAPETARAPEPPPHVRFEPVGVPMTNRKVRPRPAPDAEHNYYIEAETGLKVGEDPVSAGISDHHGTQEAAPAFATGCDAADAAPAIARCHRR